MSSPALLCITHVRHREDLLQDQAALTVDPETPAQERDFLVLLGEMIDLLPGTYRQVIKQCLYQGVSTKEISRHRHISRGNVAVRMNRVISMIKRRVDARAGPLSLQLRRQS